MNPGVYKPTSQLASMPIGPLNALRPVPMPDNYWHPEAIDWATRASANGGLISTTTIRAVSEFCRAVDAAGIRDRFARLNPFAGGNLSGALVPLYRSFSFGGTVIGNATDTNVNFVSGDFIETGATGGLKGNGANKYLNTGLTPNGVGGVTNIHMSASGTSIETGTSPRACFIGTFAAFSNQAILWAREGQLTGRVAFAGNNVATDGASTATESHYLFSRTSTTAAAVYQGGSIVNSSSAVASSTSSTTPFAVFAIAAPGISSYSAARMRMYSIGLGMTATQVAAFSAAVIQFNAALER